MRRPFRALQVREDAAATAWRERLDEETKEGRLLLRSYDLALDRIRGDFLHGEIVPVPTTARFAGVSNLRCVDLAGFHRLLYTNVRVDEGTIALVLDVLDHREYDRTFRVRKK